MIMFLLRYCLPVFLIGALSLTGDIVSSSGITSPQTDSLPKVYLNEGRERYRGGGNKRRRAQRRRHLRRRVDPMQNRSNSVSIEWLASNISSIWSAVKELQQKHEGVLENGTVVPTVIPSQDNISSLCNPGEHLACNNDPRYCTAELHNSTVCSGNGECCCGECMCNSGYMGMYCQCDSNSCPRSAGIMCGGNGLCSCGHCECSEGWTEEACDCSLETRSCVHPRNRQDHLYWDQDICSNYGDCECGRCNCWGTYHGEYCEKIPSHSGICVKLKRCVYCYILQDRKPPSCSECLAESPELNLEITVSRIENKEAPNFICSFFHQDCRLEYYYNSLLNGTVLVTIPDDLGINSKLECQ